MVIATRLAATVVFWLVRAVLVVVGLVLLHNLT